MKFMINTPSHKRWMLPDGKHYYNSVMYGDYFHDTVWNVARNELVLSLPAVKIDSKGKWKELLELSQALAEKKFRTVSSGARYMHTADWRKR